MDQNHIRNFSIIAHIDHGKTTLSDRLLEATQTLSKRESVDQFLDDMELEKERGITIKSHAVSLQYKDPESGEEFLYNLIDTPGHVDFHYEVSRSLAACDGALLVVDATQGVQAQTLANAYMAVDQGLDLIPVINKVDLPSADPERVAKEIEDVIGIDASDAILTSAKTGIGVPDILSAIHKRIAPPKGVSDAPPRAMIFDSWYDSYRGVIMLLRMMDGTLKKGDPIAFMAAELEAQIETLGMHTPHPVQVPSLGPGQVGFLTAGVKELGLIKVGDTITSNPPATEPLPGFQEVNPVVFAGFYPVESGDYPQLREALAKLSINDASFSWDPESSEALGFGFRCGFLGSLHLEIIQERLEREYGVHLITTAPTVRYRAELASGKTVDVSSPSQLPDVQTIEKMKEPYARITILTPGDYIGNIMKIFQEKRGIQVTFNYASPHTALLEYDLPLSLLITDLHEKIKAGSRGFASLDYKIVDWREAPLQRLDILVNEKVVDALSIIIHKEDAYRRGRTLALRLKRIIPRQLYEVVIQAAVGGRILARETVRPMRKNVIAKCYGGDISRKRKLLEKQKEGKKRMKQVGNVSIPQEAFLSVLKEDE